MVLLMRVYKIGELHVMIDISTVVLVYFKVDENILKRG